MIAYLDALAYLRSLPDSSVDLVVSDPPYYRVKGEPWDMAVHIVNASSRPGAVVCDPFCGSGVFLEAAKALGREPWGNDGCKHWADVTRRAVASPRPIGQGRLL